MLMDILSATVREYKQGILEDAVKVEITRCRMSYGLAGPPFETETKWFKFMIGKDEAMRRINALAAKGEQPTYEVEKLPYPQLHKTFNGLGMRNVMAQVEEMKKGMDNKEARDVCY